METTMKTFTGSTNPYVVIATRGKDELGLSMIYGIHPMNGLGGLIVRFVCRTEKDAEEAVKSFHHLQPRELGKFTDDQGQEFIGVRLNRCVIPVFHPGPPPLVFLEMCEKFLIWDIVADWVKERVAQEGFTMLSFMDLRMVLLNLVGGKTVQNDEQFKLVLEFPSFEPKPKEGE